MILDQDKLYANQIDLAHLRAYPEQVHKTNSQGEQMATLFQLMDDGGPDVLKTMKEKMLFKRFCQDALGMSPYDGNYERLKSIVHDTALRPALKKWVGPLCNYTPLMVSHVSRFVVAKLPYFVSSELCKLLNITLDTFGGRNQDLVRHRHLIAINYLITLHPADKQGQVCAERKPRTRIC